jgi:hypothetical protein
VSVHLIGQKVLKTTVFVSERKGDIKWAHNLAHKNVLNEQLKQWMQRMQCEIFLGNLVLVDLKRVNQG